MQGGIARGRRRELRQQATDAECLLWRLLRAGRFAGSRFRRQHSIGPYIVDFYCADRGLAVELDGGQHFTDEAAAYDARRTEYLGKRGVRVVRFTNLEVFAELDRVLQAIGRAVGR